MKTTNWAQTQKPSDALLSVAKHGRSHLFLEPHLRGGLHRPFEADTLGMGCKSGLSLPRELFGFITCVLPSVESSFVCTCVHIHTHTYARLNSAGLLVHEGTSLTSMLPPLASAFWFAPQFEGALSHCPGL